MNNMKKRLILFLIVFLLLQAVVLMLPMAASAEEEGTTENEVTQFVYEPIKTEYGIFNRYNYKDSSFCGYYTIYSRNAYNTITEFKTTTGPELILHKLYSKLSGKYSWENFAFSVDEATGNKVKTIYGYLATPQQKLMASMSATLINDYHTHGNWWDGKYETVGYQAAFLQRDNYYPFSRISGRDFADRKEDAVEILGTLVYNEIYPNPYKGKAGWEYYEDELQYPNLDLFIYVSAYKDYICQDGDVVIGDMSVTFADPKDPKVSKIYTINENGSTDNLFRAGEPIYLKVEFDEPVRLK